VTAGAATLRRVSVQQFVLELGRALHALGSPSYRVEDAMDACARHFGLQGSFFATPTAIMAALGAPGERHEVVLLRVEPGDQDLAKLAALYAVRDVVMRGEVTAAAGLVRVRSVLAAPATHGDLLPIPAQGLGSAAACVFVGGGGAEVLVAGIAGLLVGGFAYLSRTRPALQRAYEPAACALAAFVVHGAAACVHPLNTSVATIAAIVVLLPGLSFTTALAELAMRHLAAGSARLLGAAAVMLTMAVGVGLGDRAGTLCWGEVGKQEPQVLDAAWQWPALLAAGLAFAVLLRAVRSQLLWVMGAVAIGFIGARLGALLFERELGAFVGALCVAVAGNLYARFCRRPAAVMRTPGLLLLVPGSLGVKGLTSALHQDVAQGAQLAFQMLVVGGAIVAGLLVASVLLPPPLDVEPDSRASAAVR